MLTLFLASAFFAADIKPKDRPVYSRDLVSMQSGKMMASLIPQVIPIQSGGGGGSSSVTGTGVNGRVAFWSGAQTLSSSADLTFSSPVLLFTAGLTSLLSLGGTGATLTQIQQNTAQTPDAPTIALGTLSRGLVIIESGDEGFDFAHAQQTNPTLFIHSAAQSTTQWVGIAHSGTVAAYTTGAGQHTFNNSVQLTANATDFSSTLGGTLTFRPRASSLTPDGGFILTDTTAESIHVAQVADGGFDFNNGRAGTGAQTNPALIIHSADQSAIEYIQITAETVVGMGKIETLVGGQYIGAFKANITEGSAQSIVTFGIPTAGMFGATVFYTVYDSDGTDHIARSGNIVIQGVNKGGTAVCTINAARDTEAEDGSQVAQTAALTLTYTWTNVVSTSNCVLSLNAASNAGANTLDITYNIEGTASTLVTVTPN